MSNNLTLLIYAGKEGTPIPETNMLTIGEVPEHFVPIEPVFVKDEKVWIICHTRDYNVYEYHTTNAMMIGTGQQAFIHISLIIPSKLQLKEESPLTLLEAVEDEFKRRRMNGISLNTAPVQKPFFDEILNQFQLVKREPMVPVMKGDTPAVMNVNRIQVKSMMKFTSYPFFSKIAHLELGLDCVSNITLKDGGRFLTDKEKKKKDEKVEKKAETGQKEGFDNGNKSSTEKADDNQKPEPGLNSGGHGMVSSNYGIDLSSNSNSVGGNSSSTTGGTTLGGDTEENHEGENRGSRVWVVVLILLILGIIFLIYIVGQSHVASLSTPIHQQWTELITPFDQS